MYYRVLARGRLIKTVVNAAGTRTLEFLPSYPFVLKVHSLGQIPSLENGLGARAAGMDGGGMANGVSNCE
jgi:hypothetical protein